MTGTTHTDGPEILVGTDGTATALRAVAWAAAEAKVRRLPLRIVHVAPYATPADSAGRRHAAAILGRAYTVAHQLDPQLPVHTERLGGEPVDSLVNASERAELLVIGLISGDGGEIVLGSVAYQVIAEAHCPVTVVHHNHRTAPSTHPVLLGVDDIDADAPAAAVAFADAELHGAPLIVAHVQPGALRGRLTGTESDEEATRTLTERLAPWHARHPGVAVDVRVLHGTPATELSRAAIGARLVVVATHGRHAPARALLGSTSRALVRFSRCPVTVVRRHDTSTAAQTASIGKGDQTTRPR